MLIFLSLCDHVLHKQFCKNWLLMFPGPGMTTEIVITGEEAAVEVLIGMIVTGLGGTGIFVAGAGAVV
jgi:hypothetical protein